MTISDRPTPRSRPRPANDETIDPVVTDTARVTTARLPVVAVRRGPEPTVQLNVRIAADINELVDRAVAASGRTKRQLIEHAVRSTYSQQI